MERLSKIFDENKKAFAYGAGAIGASAVGFYAYKRFTQKPSVLRDAFFKTENLSLYSAEAERRAEVIHSVKYRLLVKLNENEKDGFNGAFQASFKLNQKAEEVTFLDFQGEEISQIQVNNQTVGADKIRFEKHRIHLPVDLLSLEKENTVSFHFKNTYVSNSAGLHYYRDPQDQGVYIYSHLEPFFCHRFFPCFDQPDIRAPLKLSVISPQKEWNVIGNGVEKSRALPLAETEAQKTLADLDLLVPEGGSDKGWLWDFEESPPISSYIYALCAGEYKQINNTDKDAPTPMRIFARKSKLDFVDDKVFGVIKTGIAFYEDLFARKFPFAKYDLIFCPEFRISAMENVGAITFSDRYLMPKDEQTDFIKMLTSYIHLHELAHMWFGDLTTMKWWNDLWLKESFADFCSATCMIENPDLNSVYPHGKQLFMNFITAALDADLAPTTHPIQTPILHTGDATSAFDMISYRKGASWIKTMDNYIGRESTRKGLQKYVELYAYKNATLDDLVKCFEEAHREIEPNSNLKEWTNSWLKYSSPNQISAVVKDGAIALEQTFAKHGDKEYRAQRVDVLVWTNENPSTPLEIKNVHVDKA